MVNFFRKRIIITTILITSHTITITPKTVRIACISIKVVSIIIILLIHLTIRWLLLGPPWRRQLFNMFNPGNQTVNCAHELIKFPIDLGVLVIKKPRKLIPGYTLVEIRRGLHSFP
jgi:hypothetical protein